MIFTVDGILSLLFPPRCIFCGGVLTSKTGLEICKECFKKIEFMEEKNSRSDVLVPKGSNYDAVVCACKYSGIVKETILKFKFTNKPSYYRTLAELLVKEIKLRALEKEIDLIVSIPLHRMKENTRGYNQSRLIAKYISKAIKLPDKSSLVYKKRYTESQSRLSKDERMKNVEGAFALSKKSTFSGKRVLLIDDILTTGSTLNECSKILKEAGAVSVIAGVIASGRT